MRIPIANPVSDLPPIAHKVTELLAIRDHSQQELAQKLNRKGYPTEEIAAILTEFVDKNWLNDQDFAAQLIDQALRKQQGPLKVRQQLQQKGVSSDDSALAMEAIDVSDWAEAARGAWEKRFGEAPTDAKAAAKQWRFLAQRGFAQDHIRRGIPEINDF